LIGGAVSIEVGPDGIGQPFAAHPVRRREGQHRDHGTDLRPAKRRLIDRHPIERDAKRAAKTDVEMSAIGRSHARDL